MLPKSKSHEISFEELIVELPDGTTYTKVEAIRSFPLTDSNKYISLLDSEEKEIGIIQDIKQLPRESEKVLRSELQKTVFFAEDYQNSQFGWRIWCHGVGRGDKSRSRYLWYAHSVRCRLS